MLDQQTRNAIRQAFRSGQLRVKSVVPETGEVKKMPIKDVMRHHTSHKPMVRITLQDNRSVTCTIDHSVFQRSSTGIVPVEAGVLAEGDEIITVVDGDPVSVTISKMENLDPHQHTFDLCVPGSENFVLANGILAHNSYSIGGISLDINKSSKYESLKGNAEGQFDKLTEIKPRTTKIIRGLQQPRFGVGIRSAFGSHVGRGILSPRAFIS